MEIIREDYHFDTLVIARNHLENRGFAPYPCQVEQWLKEHDNELEIWWNARENKYRVIGEGYWTIMEFSDWQLSYGIVEHIKRIDSRRGYRAMDEIDKADFAHKKEQDRITEDVAYNLAKDTKKYVSTLN